MLGTLIDTFEQNLGLGLENSEFDKQETPRERNRHKGFRKLLMCYKSNRFWLGR